MSHHAAVPGHLSSSPVRRAGLSRTLPCWRAPVPILLLLLIGIGPKIALVPFLGVTADMPAATKGQVVRKMLTTAAAVAVLLLVLGGLLTRLLHFSAGALGISSGIILLIIAISMVLLSIHWQALSAFAMLWMWGVVIFGLASAIGYFQKFWRKVDDSIKLRRRKELLSIERRRRKLARAQAQAAGEKMGQWR